MKKVLKSGKVYMGTCGEPTGLTDSFGEPLFIGDLVDVYSEMPLRCGSCRDTYGPEYIVTDENGKVFIMGLKNSLCKKTEYYLDGEETDGTEYDYSQTYYVDNVYPETDPGYKWVVKKIKGYQDTVDGECWGSGNVTTHLETGDEQEKLDEI